MRTISVPITLLLSVCLALPATAGWDEGVAAFTQKNFDQAAKEFQELVDQNPEGWRGHYMLGLCFEKLQRQEDALSHLRKAYDLNPNDLSIKFALGRAYFKLRRYGDASKLLGSVDPASLPAAQQASFYQMRGQSRLKGGDTSGAVGDFSSLAELQPRSAQVLYTYGALALSVGQTDVGIDALARATMLAPSDASMKRAYAQALIKKGRMSRDKAAKKDAYARAAEVAKGLVALDSSYDNEILKITAELGAGLYPEAIESGKAATAKTATDWLAHYYLGQAYTSNAQYAEAEAPLKNAAGLTTKPDDLKLVWRQLGFAYEKQKKFSQAIEAYQNAGDQAGAARVSENAATDRFNRQAEEESKEIAEMEAEAKRLEAELKALEEGGGGPLG